MTLVVALVALSATPQFSPYTSKQDGFSIDFPGAPKVESDKEKGKKRKKSKVVTRTYTVDVDDGLYSVMVLTDPAYASYTEDDIKSEYDAFRDAEKTTGKIIADRPFTLGTSKGVELTIEGKEMDSVVRMFVSGKRGFSIIGQLDKGKTAKDLDLDHFFGSFALLDDSGAVIAKATPLAATPPPPPAQGTTPAAKATPAGPAVGPANVHDLVVTAKGEGKKKQGLAMKWLSDVHAAGDASIEVKAKCTLVDGQTHKLKKSAPVPAGLAGKTADLELSMTGLPNAPKQCELEFQWVSGGKSDRIDLECWPGAGRDIYGGPCGD